LFRHKRNEEKRAEAISCFQKVWTAANIFGRLQEGRKIRWNLTPNEYFLPKELGAWMVPPIRIIRRSPSLDPEATFLAQSDLEEQIDDFIQGIGANWRPAPQRDSPPAPTRTPTEVTLRQEGRTEEEVTSTEVAPPSPAGSPQPNSSPPQTALNPVAAGEGCPHQPISHQASMKATSRNKQKCKRRLPILPAHHDLTNTPHRAPPQSRTKARCSFGPRTGRARSRTDPPCGRESSPPEVRSAFVRRWDVSMPSLPETLRHNTLIYCSPPGPAKVTLLPHSPCRRTPFDRYRGKSPLTSERASLGIAINKLGTTAQAFEVGIQKEVESFFREVAAEKSLPLNDESPTALPHCSDASASSPRPLSKEECLRMLQGKKLTSGSLIGVLKWAMDPEGVQSYVENGDAPSPNAQSTHGLPSAP
jgi:hypothetical protein